jgi:hypothetical protein
MGGFAARFVTFDKLIATSIIKLLYWVGVAFVLVSSIIFAFSGFANGFGAGLLTLILSPVVALLGVVFWRLVCEMWIVLFGMYDRLGEINDKLTKSA